MARNNQRGRKNNNPEGHNQYTNDWMDSAKERPFTTAAAAAAAVGAGVFLWSRRNEISGQISRLSDQITDWADDMRTNMSSSSDSEMAMADSSMASGSMGSSSRSPGSRSGRSTSSRSSGSTARATGGESSTTGANMSVGTSGSDGIAH